MINWAETHKIFGDYEKPVISWDDNNICYNENGIDGIIDMSYFDKIMNEIHLFKHVRYEYNFRKIDTYMGKDYAMVKSWYGFDSSKNKCKLEYWVTNEKGWAAIFSNKHDFLIIGKCNNHPFITTKDFDFNDSYRSNFDNTDYTIFDLDGVKDLIKLKLKKYIFSHAY